MEDYAKTQNAIVQALTPINHFKLYFLPFLLRVDGKCTAVDVPCVLGSALRGLGRRLMHRHVNRVLSQALGANFDEALSDVPALQRSCLSAMFENGGSKMDLGAMTLDLWDSSYQKILDDLPMLDLLGGNYMNYCFPGMASIGILILRTQETQEFYENKLQLFEHSAEALPHLLDVTSGIERTGALSNGSFYWRNSLDTTFHEGTALAFDAFLALIARHQWIGKLNGKRYWRAGFQFDGMDPDVAIKKFDEFLSDNKENVIDGLHLLVESFDYVPEAAIHA